MKRPEEIVKIVMAAKSTTKLPISVKTRAGWDNYKDIYDLALELEKTGLDMLIIHPRTVKQSFTGSADWSIIKKLVADLPELPIIGSGDVTDWQDALDKQQDTSCAGAMIGRNALGHPWIFKEIREKKSYQPDQSEIRGLTIDLASKADAIWGQKGITESKKHFAWYFRGFDGASEYRKKLMGTKTLTDVENLLT